MWYPVWTQQQSRVRSRAAHPLCDQCSHSCGIPGRGHEAHRGSQQQARPPVTASTVWLGQGQGQGQPQAVPTQGCGGLPPQPQPHKAGRTNRNKRGLRAPGFRVPASRSRAGLAGRRPPEGAPEPCKGRGRSTGVPHPSPAPAPEKPPAAAQRAQPGAGPWRCGGGGAPPRLPARGVALASLKSRLHRQGREAFPGRPARPGPPLQPAPPGGADAGQGCARCRVSEADLLFPSTTFCHQRRRQGDRQLAAAREQRERVGAWPPPSRSRPQTQT